MAEPSPVPSPIVIDATPIEIYDVDDLITFLMASVAKPSAPEILENVISGTVAGLAGTTTERTDGADDMDVSLFATYSSRIGDAMPPPILPPPYYSPDVLFFELEYQEVTTTPNVTTYNNYATYKNGKLSVELTYDHAVSYVR